jgi:endonuclease/exonuclease/phosphatase family metal-dependent hydrolase
VGTFGVALLSRYPLLEPATFYMLSEGEQTAAIRADVATPAGRCRLVVTHLGNGGPMAQQENVLQAIAGQGGLLLMGDFNFRPDTPQYERTTSGLADAWQAAGAAPATSLDPSRRIDHLFVTPDVTVESADYILSPASDHPALLAEVLCPAD